MKAATATTAWLVLLAVTTLSWWLAGAGGPAPGGSVVAIICLGLFKMYLVLAIFMGIWKSPLIWHGILASCLALTGAVLIFLAVPS